jgi:hypothetical protein
MASFETVFVRNVCNGCIVSHSLSETGGISVQSETLEALTPFLRPVKVVNVLLFPAPPLKMRSVITLRCLIEIFLTLNSRLIWLIGSYLTLLQLVLLCKLWYCTNTGTVLDTVACRTVARQRSRDKYIYTVVNN